MVTYGKSVSQNSVSYLFVLYENCVGGSGARREKRVSGFSFTSCGRIARQ